MVGDLKKIMSPYRLSDVEGIRKNTNFTANRPPTVWYTSKRFITYITTSIVLTCYRRRRDKGQLFSRPKTLSLPPFHPNSLPPSRASTVRLIPVVMAIVYYDDPTRPTTIYVTFFTPIHTHTPYTCWSTRVFTVRVVIAAAAESCRRNDRFFFKLPMHPRSILFP